MGYAIAFGPCIRCKRVFGFNPHKVPSTSAVTGQREPICRDCFEQLNLRRGKLGLEPWVLPENAYEPIDEHEL